MPAATYHQGVHMFDAVSFANTMSAGTHFFGGRSYMDLASASYNVWTLTNVQSALTCNGSSSSASEANATLSVLIRELVRKGVLQATN